MVLRIALANLRFPATPSESVTLAEKAIAQASVERADVVYFPECFALGCRAKGKRAPPPDPTTSSVFQQSYRCRVTSRR